MLRIQRLQTNKNCNLKTGQFFKAAFQSVLRKMTMCGVPFISRYSLSVFPCGSGRRSQLWSGKAEK